MKTDDDWIHEWTELDFALPPRSRLGDPEAKERALRILGRIQAIRGFVFGYGPKPPEEWECPRAPTPEAEAEERAERAREFMEEMTGGGK